jgi:hypothetical protein
MTTGALEIVVFAGMATFIGWGAALVGPEPWRPSVAREAERLRGAFRDRAIVDGMLRSSRAAAKRAEAFVPPGLPAAARERILAGLVVSALRARMLAEAVPLVAAVLLAAASLGLARRERQRSGIAFASPLRASFGKHLAALGVSGLLAFALVPVPLLPETVWWGTAGAAWGTGLWVAHLPLKV